MGSGVEPSVGDSRVVSKHFAAKKNMDSRKSSAKFWLILGAVFILLDPVLAHVSNADLVRWSYGLEYVASGVLLGAGVIFLIIDAVKMRTEKLRKNSE